MDLFQRLEDLEIAHGLGCSLPGFLLQLASGIGLQDAVAELVGFFLVDRLLTCLQVDLVQLLERRGFLFGKQTTVDVRRKMIG